MSIQTIPRDERDQFGSNLGNAISGAFNQSFQGGLERQYAEAQKKQKEVSLGAALSEAEKVYANPNLSPEEKQIGLYKALKGHPEVAQHLGQQLPAVTKSAQPKATKSPAIGTVPTNPEVVTKINQIKATNPKATADQLQSAFEEAQISPHDYNPHVVNARAIEKNAIKQQQVENQNKLQVHKTSEDFAAKIKKEAENARHTKSAISTARQAFKTHKTGPLTAENFTKKYLKGTPWENLGLTPEGAIIEATIPTFLEGFKDIVGVRLSDADLGVVLGKSIDLGKTNQENEAILAYNEKLANYRIEKEKIARELAKKSGGYRGINFEDEVNEEFDKRYGSKVDKDFVDTFLGDKIKMKFPDGKVRMVDKKNYESAVLDQGKRI